MAKNIQKGSEFSNISETWEHNERIRDEAKDHADNREHVNDRTAPDELELIIHEKAFDYDLANKEDRLLGGDRASVHDDEGSSDDKKE